MRVFIVILGLLLATAVPVTSQESVEDLRARAEQGDAKAQFELGHKHFWGEGVPQDVQEGVKWCRAAAEQGHTDAQLFLAITRFESLELPQEFLKGLLKGLQYQEDQETFQEAAKWVSNQEAHRWLRAAAEQGLDKAQVALGLAYNKGDMGVPQNYLQAEIWYGRAAEQGDVTAQRLLGLMYESGTGGTGIQSDELAYFWYSLAAASGDPDAVEARDRVAQRMTPEQRFLQQARVKKWWEKHEEQEEVAGSWLTTIGPLDDRRTMLVNRAGSAGFQPARGRSPRTHGRLWLKGDFVPAPPAGWKPALPAYSWSFLLARGAGS